MMKIRIGEPQPEPCPTCGENNGYQYSDHMTLHHTFVHNEDGSFDSSFLSDYRKTLHQATTAYCANCHCKLPFKLIRQHGD